MLSALVAEFINIILFALIVAAVMKIVQISTDVREAKEALLDIKRALQTPEPAPAPAAVPAAISRGPLSPEELVRAVNSQSYEAALALEPADPLAEK